MKIRVRFAPSPTGHLHVGNVRTALFNWFFARKQGGAFILRIEDTDVARSTVESENIIYEDLKWIGLDWDEGPDGGGRFGPYRQSERLNLYKKYIDELLEKESAYRCFCSPEELEEQRRIATEKGLPPRYNRKCLALSENEIKSNIEKGVPFSVRFRTPDNETITWFDAVKGKTEIPSEVVGDQIIFRANGMPRYNYACVVDDHLMEITHVIRGDDHVPNTPIQILVYRALGWEPPKFAHLSMIVGPDHSRLSKRHGATSINQFKEDGYLPEALLNHLALLGWSPGNDKEKMGVQELIDKFSLKKVSPSPAVFDIKKLCWLNSLYIRELEPSRLMELLAPFLIFAGYINEKVDDSIKDWLIDFVSAIRTDIETLRDCLKEIKNLMEYNPLGLAENSDEREILDSPDTSELLTTVLEEFEKAPPISKDKYKDSIIKLMNRTGKKGREFFHPIRVALTGRISGMELELFIPLIEKGSRLQLKQKIMSPADRLHYLLDNYYG